MLALLALAIAGVAVSPAAFAQPKPQPSTPKGTVATSPRRIVVRGSYLGDTDILPGFASGFGMGAGVRTGDLRTSVGSSYFFQRVKHFDAAGQRGLKVSLLTFDLVSCYDFRWSQITVGPCVAVEMGVYRSKGFGSELAVSDHSFWLATRTGPDIRWEFSESGRIVVETSLSIGLRRPTFFLEPGLQLFQPSPFSARVGLGLEVEF